MVQLTFSACIFSGIVCDQCKHALDNVKMYPSNLKDHWAQKHDDMQFDTKKEFKRLTVEMKNAAKCLLSFNTEFSKKEMCEAFLDEINGVWCNHETCQRGYKDEQQHVGETRLQHKGAGHFTPQELKYPILPKSTTLL